MMRKYYIGTVMFLGLMVGMFSVHADMNDRAGISNNKTADLQQEYDAMQESLYGEDKKPGVEGGCSNNTGDCGLYENVKTLSNPLEDVFSTAGAAFYIIPQLMSFLLAPVQILYQTVQSIMASFPMIPTWIETFITFIITAGISFAIIAAVLRWR